MSQEIMRYVTLEADGYIYVHTVEDHSDDHNPNNDDFTQGYTFSYPVMPMSQASQSPYREKRVDDFIENGGSETENFKAQVAFDIYIDIIKHSHDVNELYIIDDTNTCDATVGDIAHQLLIKVRKSKSMSQIQATDDFTC